MNENKKIFKGGRIVLPGRVVQGSLMTENGIVSGIVVDRADKADEGWETVDVSGRVLLPGLIDSHVHMWDPSPLNYREDWGHGSQAAAAGGITTIVEMPLSVPPVTDEEGFWLKRRTAEANSCVDFALWGGLVPSCIDQLAALNELGCVAYKGFMSFANDDYPQITDGYLVKGMREAVKFDGLVGVHAENAECADFGSREMMGRGCMDESMHDEARPWWTELEAIQRAVLFSKATGARLLICHMTIVEGAEFLKKARAEGIRVGVETCPHYLIFDKEMLREKKSYAKCNPPLRSRENVERLWDYVFDGTIEVVGSDHGPYSDGEKIQKGDFWKEYCGFGGYDAMLAGLITEGVHKRGLSLTRLAEITSFNAARILGLAPKKGSLLPGSDADIAVVDLEREWTYDGSKSFSKTKSVKGIYQGMRMKGQVTATYVRGERIYDSGTIIGKPGFGKFVPKQK